MSDVLCDTLKLVAVFDSTEKHRRVCLRMCFIINSDLMSQLVALFRSQGSSFAGSRSFDELSDLFLVLICFMFFFFFNIFGGEF